MKLEYGDWAEARRLYDAYMASEGTINRHTICLKLREITGGEFIIYGSVTMIRENKDDGYLDIYSASPTSNLPNLDTEAK
jgi:hypothetical protein